MPTSPRLGTSKLSEKGSVTLVLLPVFILVLSVAAFYIYKTFNFAKNKLTLQSEVLAVELKNEYDNPFDKSAQYVNPFSSRKNPFDSMK